MRDRSLYQQASWHASRLLALFNIRVGAFTRGTSFWSRIARADGWLLDNAVFSLEFLSLWEVSKVQASTCSLQVIVGFVESPLSVNACHGPRYDHTVQLYCHCEEAVTLLVTDEQSPVARDGIEPPTQGFSVLCSTVWATEPPKMPWKLVAGCSFCNWLTHCFIRLSGFFLIAYFPQFLMKLY